LLNLNFVNLGCGENMVLEKLNAKEVKSVFNNDPDLELIIKKSKSESIYVVKNSMDSPKSLTKDYSVSESKFYACIDTKVFK
jgi:hypothetical protein